MADTRLTRAGAVWAKLANWKAAIQIAGPAANSTTLMRRPSKLLAPLHMKE